MTDTTCHGCRKPLPAVHLHIPSVPGHPALVCDPVCARIAGHGHVVDTRPVQGPVSPVPATAEQLGGYIATGRWSW